ncbi:MAG: leucyl aminopeptidase family protein [Alphaproteobacteria bacterium]|nr:leucyl aminopeptidase family protein [Alphaproteobacteria bacterium]
MSQDAAGWPRLPDLDDAFADKSASALPIWMVGEDQDTEAVLRDAPVNADWLKSVGFKGKARQDALVSGPDGSLAGAVLGTGDGKAGAPCGPSELLAGLLPRKLPVGTYRLASSTTDSELAAIAWGLGAYRFRRYRQGNQAGKPQQNTRLVVPDGVDEKRIRAIVEGVWLGRDLINTPASDMGPDELEAASRLLAKRHGAQIDVTTGDDLLKNNLPMIHAVGRASNRAPRLIDLTWQPAAATGKLKTVTLVGKGICFDTGGLDLKPAAGMILMKKDMGGSASALALAHMIMSLGLNVRLRVLIPAAENSVAGNAFRPSDILQSRLGKSVEVGNTDAEGRLVLADALALADEEEPDLMISLATLTGAARVALGPDLPAFFSNDDAFADAVGRHGLAVGDPVWRMPFWSGYEETLKSDVADMNNISNSPFAGAITAALFLKRFVSKAHSYAHIDMYGWRPSARPLGPKGGEPHAARALLSALSEEDLS